MEIPQTLQVVGQEVKATNQKEPTLILISQAGWVKELFGERESGLPFSRNLSFGDGRNRLPNPKINVVGGELHTRIAKQHVNSAGVSAAGADVFFSGVLGAC